METLRARFLNRYLRIAISNAPERWPNKRLRAGSSIRCCSTCSPRGWSREGNFEESLRLLQRAVTISPGDVGARNALALCLQRLDRPAEALHHVDELLKKHPDLPFAHANKGNALISLGWLGRAKQSHLRALELEPGNLAATAALASIATHRGEHDEARRWAEQALKLAPGFPDAVLSLAAAELASGASLKAETLLHQLILDSRAGPSDKARASGLLGDVLDILGRYAPRRSMHTRPATKHCGKFIGASQAAPACSRTRVP